MKLHQFFFWLFVFFLPSQLGKHFWPDFSFIFGLRVDYLSPTLYWTDLLLLGTLLAWFGENQLRIFPDLSWGSFRKYWLLGFFLLFLLVTSFVSVHPDLALIKFLRIVELLFLFFYISANFSWLGQKVIWPLALGIFYETVLVWAQFLKQGSVGGPFWFLGERTFSTQTPGIALAAFGQNWLLRPYGTFSHPNSLAGYFLISLILIFTLGKNWPSGLKISIFLLGASVVILSFSGAVWLASFLIGLLFIFRFLGKRNWSLICLFGSLSFLTVLFLFDWQSQQVWERIKLFRLSLAMIKEFPLVGVSLGHFVIFLPRFWPAEGLYFLQPVHNLFLLVAAETGFLGLLFFLWFLALSLKKALVGKQRGLLLALAAILFTGIFDHYWLTLQQNQLLATILLGLVWGNQVKLGKMKT